MPWIRATPRSSVLPCQMRLPLQSRMETSAPATGPARVEGRDPDERGLAAPLEMSRQVRHKGRRGHVQGGGLSQEVGAQDAALELHDVEAGLSQGDADHLEGLSAFRHRQLEFLSARLSREDGLLAGGCGDVSQPVNDPLLPVEIHFPDLALHLLGDGRRLPGGLRLSLSASPGRGLRVLGEDLLGLSLDGKQVVLQLCFDVSHRHGQKRVCRLEDPEAGGKLRKRGIALRLHRQREPVGVGQGPPRVILHPLRHCDGEIGLFGEGSRKGDHLCNRVGSSSSCRLSASKLCRFGSGA